MTSLQWYKNNSMVVSQTVDGSVDTASLTGTLTDSSGTVLWTDSVDPSGTDDLYEALVHPNDAAVIAGRSCTLTVAGTVGVSSIEFVAQVQIDLRGPGD